MSAAWLFLYLGGIVHLLALSGFGGRHPANLLPLLPVVAAVALPPLLRHRPSLLPPAAARFAGLAGFAGALAFVKAVHMEAWDSQAWLPSLAAALAGVGGLLAVLPSTAPPGRAVWLWIAFWMAAGRIDPALPVLGAGLGAMLAGSGIALEAGPPVAESAPLRHPWLTLFLLGLALPKPWWDFGLDRQWAWASAAFGIGAALAQLAPLQSRLGRLPGVAFSAACGLLAVLYAPDFGVPWGLALGLAAGLFWPRLPRPLPVERAAAALLLGLLVSFALHANAWIPGLRHLIWLGNG